MANTRYKKLADYESVLWTFGSPVVVEKMQLEYDSVYGVNVLHITFRNVTLSRMYGLGINVVLKTKTGQKIKNFDFNYYAIEVPTGKLFGSTEDIIVEPEAAIFDIGINRVDLANGKSYSDKLTLDKMPLPTPLNFYTGKYEEEFAYRTTQIFPKAKLLCAPDKRPDYWRCTCSRIWPNEITKCTYCRTERDELLGILPAIKKEEKDRLDAERREKEEAAFKAAEEARKVEEAAALAEKERLAEEKRRLDEKRLADEEAAERAVKEAAEKKKRQKRWIISMSGFAAICLIAFILVPQLRDYHQRRSAAAEEGVITPVDDSTTGGGIEGEGREQASRIDEPYKSVLVLSSELDNTERETMLRLLEGSDQRPEDIGNITVSTDEAHAYMDGIIGRENVEKEAISGLMLIKTEEGGINIKLYNIDFYTENDYREQIEKLGIKNASVVVAAPAKASGSTAMLGLMKYSGRTSNTEGMKIGTAVAKMTMNVRVSNSILSQRIGTITPGTEINVLEVMDNAWFKIAWEDAEEGYAYTSNYHGDYYSFTLDDPKEVIMPDSTDDDGLKEEEKGQYQFDIN